jgi:hypothetical protein
MPIRRPVRGLVKVDAVASWLATFEVSSRPITSIPRLIEKAAIEE